MNPLYRLEEEARQLNPLPPLGVRLVVEARWLKLQAALLSPNNEVEDPILYHEYGEPTEMQVQDPKIQWIGPISTSEE